MQIYPDILGTDAVSDSRQMIIDRENSIKSSFSGPRAPTVTAEDVGCIWYCTADSNFYGLYSIDEDGSNPAWHKLVTPTKLNAMDLGTPTTETLYIDLDGAPCEAKKDMFVLVEHTILPVENYEITNNGQRVTFVSPIPAGLKLEIRWFVQEVIGRDGATFVPSIINNVLTWDNDQGLVNPPDLDFNANLAEIENFANEQIVAIKDTSDTEITKINNTGSTQVATVQSTGASQVNLVKQTAQEYINTMDGKLTEASNSANEAAESAEAAAAHAASVDADNIVHKTGNESIAGIKNFINTIYNTVNLADSSVVVVNNLDDNTTIPSEYQSRAFRVFDKNGKILGDIRFRSETSGNRSAQLIARNAVSGSEVTGNLVVGVDKNGSVYATAPTPADNSNGINIAVTSWVRKLFAKLDLNNVFTADQKIAKTTPIFVLDTTGGTYGEIQTRKAGVRTGGFRNIEDSGVNQTMMYVASDDGTSIKGALGINFNGTSAYTQAPTPTTSDNSTKIATTAFVKSQIQEVTAAPSNYVSGVLYVIPE